MDEKVLVEKQHKKGKLYTRERLELLFDKGIYNELTTDETRDGVWVHFTGLSGRHSVLERPLYEVNGRPFFSQKTTA